MALRPPLPPIAGSVVTTAVGLLAASLRLAARLPGKAASRAGSALPVPERLRKEYDALAERGAAVVSGLRKPGPPPEPEPAPAAVDAGAPGTATNLVEQVEEQVYGHGVASGADLDRDDLPLADFDNLTLGSVRGRLRRLSMDELVQLRGYEVAHGNRLPIVTLLDNRIAKLTAEREHTDGS